MNTQEIAYKKDGEWRLRTINSKGIKEVNITQMEKVINEIANAKNHDFRTWKERGDKLQELAKNAIKTQITSDKKTEIKVTEKEYKILELISKGYTNKQIIKELKLKESTLKTHFTNMYQKFALFLSDTNESSVMRLRLALKFLNNEVICQIYKERKKENETIQKAIRN